jgi:predicted PurR-regulated permease PerM
MEETRRPYTFDRVVRIVIIIASLIGVFYLLNILKGVLLPFLLAWLMAYFTHPLVRFFQEKCKIKSRGISVAISLISIVLFIALIALLIFPMIIDEVYAVKDLIKGYAHSIEEISVLPEYVNEYIVSFLNWDNISSILTIENIKSLMGGVFSSGAKLLSGTTTFVMTLLGVFVVILYLIFILLDYKEIQEGFRSMVPEKYSNTLSSLFDDIEDSMNTYFRGQATVAFCVGILFAIGFSIVGLPLAILLGLFIGFLNLVPYLQTIGFVPAILLTMLQAAQTGESFWYLFMLVLLVFIVVQVIQDMFLVPKIMGKAVGLNPAIILLSLSIWGTLLGFVGLIIALPLTSLCISYYRRYVLKKEK